MSTIALDSRTAADGFPTERGVPGRAIPAEATLKAKEIAAGILAAVMTLGPLAATAVFS